jgi:hypothetical protein
MEGRHMKSKYKDISFLQDIVFFFISSFLTFPSYIRRIIICFVYFDDHNPTTIYPSLKEEGLHSSYIVDVDPSPSSETYENNFFIQILPKHDQPCNHVNDTIDSPPSLIIVPYSTTTTGIFNKSIEPNFQPIDVQSIKREKMFKPLKLPSTLHPYPPKFLEYMPLFVGEDHIIVEKHLGAFHNVIENLEIIHEDVVMRLFSKYLVRDVALWFKNVEVSCISSWDELFGAFSRYRGENKSLDQYFAEFYDLKRGEDEALAIFNRKFYSFYCIMHLYIQPPQAAARLCYVIALDPKFSLLHLERRSFTFQQMFIDAQEVEDNLKACRKFSNQVKDEECNVDIDNSEHEQEGCHEKELAEKPVEEQNVVSNFCIYDLQESFCLPIYDEYDNYDEDDFQKTSEISFHLEIKSFQ